MRMTTDISSAKRDQLDTDGYCVIDHILTEDLLTQLRTLSDRMLDAVEAQARWKYQGSDIHARRGDEPLIAQLIDWQPAHDALAAMGLGDFTPDEMIIVLSKPPGGAPLYWHQDWMAWNDPISAAPWPQYLFLSYYLVDTTIANGCMRVIPGTHRKRISLHDHLVAAHEQGAHNVPEHDPAMFCDHPDAVDVPVKAGSLVIAEGRVLHAARRNASDTRRTLLLCWHRRPPTVPDYWTDEVPQVILQRDPRATYEATRVPGKYLG